MAIFKEGRTAHSDRSQGDRQRHRQLVEESIKKNLGDIIAEESIIGQNRDKKSRSPFGASRNIVLYLAIMQAESVPVAAGKNAAR